MANGSTPTLVQLHKQVPDPADDSFVAFYTLVRGATEALGFRSYSNFITGLFCEREDQEAVLADAVDKVRAELGFDHFCFRGARAYDKLREASELFIGCQAAIHEDCCEPPLGEDPLRADHAQLQTATTEAEMSRRARVIGLKRFDTQCYDVAEINRRFAPATITRTQLCALYDRLFVEPNGSTGPCCEDGIESDPGTAEHEHTAKRTKRGTLRERNPALGNVLTFMQQLVDNQAGVPLKDCTLGSGNCSGLLLCKLRCPPLLELIWSYWMEQGMLVQGLNAMTLRFQNRSYPGPDALKRFDLSPLRPLNNILWGYVQREPDRLSLARRAYEYDHHYGLRLSGQAVPAMSPADTRTQFIESFHRLLQEANRYYRTAMDTTMNADAFPALNCLRELHLVLAEGAHNQFGDLPTTARAEMLLQQWILARPEVRDFLGGRPGVPYPEAWMPHMESLRQLMGWNDASIRHYRDLATYGEQLLLSIRYLPWSTVNDSTIAAAWLTFWRPEIQGYLHSYRAVTRVDLGVLDVPITAGGLLTAQPSELIGRRRSTVPAGTTR